MKYVFSLWLLLQLSVSATGQSKRLDVPIYKDGTYNLSYILHQRHVLLIGLPDLIRNNEFLHYRIWDENNSAVDIWRASDGTIKGSTALHAQSSTAKGALYYFLYQPMPDSVASKIYAYLQQYNIATSLTNDSIADCNNIQDVHEHLLEFSTPDYYCAKLICDPLSIKYPSAIEFDSLLLFLNTNLKLKKMWVDLIYSLPRRIAYTSGSGFPIRIKGGKSTKNESVKVLNLERL